MSSAATVPVFSPDGTLGDIPADQLTAAAKAGAKPGVHIIAPDGSAGVVPADRMRDAVQAGAKIVPIQDQPIQHPGFWVTLGSDLGGMAKGAWHAAVDPLTDTHEDLVRKLHEEQAADAASENSPERQAHGAIYRNVTVPAAEAIGVNVPGMEQSAAEGDVGGVAGHAAAPVAAAAIAKGVSAAGGAFGEAADAAASSPTVRAAVTAGAKKLPVAMVRRIPYVGEVAADVYKAGAEAAAKAGESAPETEAAPDEPAQPLPKPKAKIVKQSTALGPNAQVQTQAQALGEPRTIVTDPATGRPEFSDVVAAKQPAAVPARVTPPEPTVPQQPQPQPGRIAAPEPTAPGTTQEPGPSGDELLDRLKGIAGRIEKQETAAPGTASDDLTQQLEDSLALVRARKAVAAGNVQPAAIEAAPEPGAGVMTSAAPKDLLGRWGVDQDSFTEGRAQTRGMKPDESAAAVAKLKKAYQNGQAVEPVMETRDAANNIIDVDGRGRALAAHQAGIERIPIVVRRMPPTPQAMPAAPMAASPTP